MSSTLYFTCIELKSELQETKAILDTYISKQQQQEAVEGNYNYGIYVTYHSL